METLRPIPLRTFWQMLDQFDWYYAFSDDSVVFREGHNAESRLYALSAQSPEHRALFEAFHRHMFSGPAWETEQAPKPPKPEVP